MKMPDLTPDLVLNAYASGIFPMADDAAAKEIYWYDPPLRGQLPIKDIHIPRRLKKRIRQAPFRILINTNFTGVIDGCARRDTTWINQTIRDTFCDLHRMGFAHSVEAWEGKKLVGGIYGLALGGAFFGESMFSRKTDASKICLIHLAARLHYGGFTVLDTQFMNTHLKQFGAFEISREDYQKRLKTALQIDADFYCNRFFNTPSKDGRISSASSSDTAPSFSNNSPSVCATSGTGEAALISAFLQSRTQTS